MHLQFLGSLEKEAPAVKLPAAECIEREEDGDADAPYFSGGPVDPFPYVVPEDNVSHKARHVVEEGVGRVIFMEIPPCGPWTS